MKKGLIRNSLIAVLASSMLLAGCGDALSAPEPSLEAIEATASPIIADEQIAISANASATSTPSVGLEPEGQAGGVSADTVSTDIASTDLVSDNSVPQEGDVPDTGNDQKGDEGDVVAEATQTIENEVVTAASLDSQVSSLPARSSSPRVLVPAASGTSVIGNQYISIDISNISQGYFMAHYLGSAPKVKLQLTGPGGSTYTYNMTNASLVIPLSTGSGAYNIKCCENITDNQYAVVFQEDISANITNTFGPFLYPNCYVGFTSSSALVSRAQSVVANCTSDLEAVEAIYDYVVGNISYDAALAANAPKGYVPNPDATFSSGKGICFDYAALMAAMLRSQGIPTRVEVGYAKDAYHAWISVYIADRGWVNGIIEFKGNSWTLMDPTYAANNSEAALRSFIGNGSNYVTKYMY